MWSFIFCTLCIAVFGAAFVRKSSVTEMAVGHSQMRDAVQREPLPGVVMLGHTLHHCFSNSEWAGMWWHVSNATWEAPMHVKVSRSQFPCFWSQLPINAYWGDQQILEHLPSMWKTQIWVPKLLALAPAVADIWAVSLCIKSLSLSLCFPNKSTLKYTTNLGESAGRTLGTWNPEQECQDPFPASLPYVLLARA